MNPALMLQAAEKAFEGAISIEISGNQVIFPWGMNPYPGHASPEIRPWSQKYRSFGGTPVLRTCFLPPVERTKPRVLYVLTSCVPERIAWPSKEAIPML